AGFEAVAPSLPGGPEVAALRRAAIQRFRAIGLPHRRVEAWHYTDLRALMRTVPPLAEGQAPADELRAALAEEMLGGLDRARLVIADGAFRPELSDLSGLDGVSVVPVA